MELIASIYLLIGFLVGIQRLSKVGPEEDSSMVCIGITLIMLLWPIYILYELILYYIYK